MKLLNHFPDGSLRFGWNRVSQQKSPKMGIPKVHCLFSFFFFLVDESSNPREVL